MNETSYTEVEVLYLGHRTRVVRAVDGAGNPVILKQLRSQWPTAFELARLRREHDLLKSLNAVGVLEVVGNEIRGVPQLVTKDPGAVALSSWMSEARTTAATALKVALNLTQCLAEIHARGVLHRDLNPSNCVIHPQTHQVWLIDLDQASPVPHRRTRPQPLANLEGTPAYMSPEQTGRMNRAVDARSDLYALGVTLYELFAGTTPFVREDLLAYAHAHLAQQPQPLKSVVPNLPPATADLIADLLQKRPEDRYQSAAGVASDLQLLIGQLTAPTASLSGRTVSPHLDLPQSLYGRENDVDQLTQALASTCDGDVQVVLVSGEAGVGKTSLVHELYKPTTLAGARLLEGKFDQFSRGIPYTALNQVLSTFVTDVLSTPTAEVERWRARILSATTPNAGLLVHMAPDLALLLGPQPPVPDLGPTEGQLRLHETLRRILGAIASPDSPLVLFLDDLQWADLPSLRLLEAMFLDPDLSHFLLIGSWRAEEVDAEHALRPTLQSIHQTGTSLHRINLTPLQPLDVSNLIADAMHQSVPEVATLASIVQEKVRGNPFFLHRFMDQAVERGAIHFNLADRAWQWDLAQIDHIGIADNVIGLLKMELERISGDARVCLAAAALLGDAFGLEVLTMATGMPRNRLVPAVGIAVGARLLSPIDEDWWTDDTQDSPGFRFAFVHDRVQQAARSLSTDQERAAIQLALARGLAASPDFQTTPFQAAEHYAAALHLVDQPEERSVAAGILSNAGHRALQSAAYTPAHTFLEAAIRASHDDLWTAQPDAAHRLWTQGARAAWVAGNNECFQRHIASLRTHARDIVDRLKAEEILVQATIAKGDLHGALDAALNVLESAGVHLPRKPTPKDVSVAIGATMGVVGDADLRSVTAKVYRNNPIDSAVRSLMVRISSAAYVAEPNLLPLIACDLVKLTINHGASRESSYGFGVYALCLSAGWLLEAGNAQGRIALGLLDRFPDRALDGTVRHVVHHFTHVWNRPLRQVYDSNPNVYRSLMDAGDLEYAGWVMHMRVVNGLFSGVPLDELAVEIEQAVQMMRVHDIQPALHCTLQFEQLVKGLRGLTDNPATLRGPDYDDEALLAHYVDIDFGAAALTLSLCRQMAGLYFDDAIAITGTDDVMRFQAGALAVFYQVPMRVYGAAALFDSDRDTIESIALAEQWRVPVAASAKQNAANAVHLLALIDAEIARARGDFTEATRRYDAAIVHAGRNGFTHDEALANERAAKMHRANGSNRIAQAYLLDARNCWMRWGATAKVNQLDRTYPTLLSPAILREPAPRQARLTSSQDPLSSHSLDLDSVLKASQAIAEETGLDSLLRRSMSILLESVGARRGVLLLAQRDDLLVEAITEVGKNTRLTHGSEFAHGKTLVPSIVRRVWRKGSAEVHDNARDARGAEDAPKGDGPLSVLCAPITYRGRQQGVLYFENDLSAGAFTPARVRVLEMLAPQLAVTLRNVRLYEAQNRFVPAQFIRSLGHTDIVDVRVGDHKIKKVSVFFSDIWGFTPLVEKLSAKQALGLINRYLSFAEPAISGSGGFIDTYLGDGIMALFDDPSASASSAVTAAIACHRALDRFNGERRRSGLGEIRTGIGINTGVVTMGTIGGKHSLKCGVVGDAVNLAARIEGLTRKTGSRLLIGEDTKRELTPTTTPKLRRAGRVRVKGRQKPVNVYEVLDAEAPDVINGRLVTLAQFETALDAYYKGDMENAIFGFSACVEQAPADVLAGLFLDLSQSMRARGVPENWDGIQRLTEK